VSGIPVKIPSGREVTSPSDLPHATNVRHGIFLEIVDVCQSKIEGSGEWG